MPAFSYTSSSNNSDGTASVDSFHCNTFSGKYAKENKGNHSGALSQENWLRRREWLTSEAVLEAGTTSLMLHGLPPSCTKDMLLRHLNQTGFKGHFDYVHMPFDLKSFVTKGYAFVNMTSCEAAAALVDAWTGASLVPEAGALGHPLVLSFTAAAQQGLEAQVQEMHKSKLVHIRNPHYRPFIAKKGKATAAAQMSNGSW